MAEAAWMKSNCSAVVTSVVTIVVGPCRCLNRKMKNVPEKEFILNVGS